MADASEIRHAEELLRIHLSEWRDAGGPVESVTSAILRLIVARERFAAEGGWALAKPAQTLGQWCDCTSFCARMSKNIEPQFCKVARAAHKATGEHSG